MRTVRHWRSWNWSQSDGFKLRIKALVQCSDLSSRVTMSYLLHAVFPSKCQTNFKSTFEKKQKEQKRMKWELGVFPSPSFLTNKLGYTK